MEQTTAKASSAPRLEYGSDSVHKAWFNKVKKSVEASLVPAYDALVAELATALALARKGISAKPHPTHAKYVRT